MEKQYFTRLDVLQIGQVAPPPPDGNHTVHYALTSGVTDPISHWKPPGQTWQSSTEAAPVVLR